MARHTILSILLNAFRLQGPLGSLAATKLLNYIEFQDRILQIILLLGYFLSSCHYPKEFLPTLVLLGKTCWLMRPSYTLCECIPFQILNIWT